jgi:UTP--glucose-1-phosphate uridylyltransferase
MSIQKVTKAVFPVAGLGTRFLPATKASPKEMLPVVDKPLIQYAVEEAAAAGITEMIFVTSQSKRAIEDHFDRSWELENLLAKRQKAELLELVQKIKPAHVNCIYVRQAEALGLGHAVLCAESVVGNEPFAVLLADDLLDATTPVLRQMLQQYEANQASVVAVERILPAQTRSYGVVAGLGAVQCGEGQAFAISGIVEKPAPEEAPSNLGVVGRYVLDGRIFDKLRNLKPGSGGEIQLTDGIQALLQEQAVMAYLYEGVRYDCGSKLGYLKASVDFALRHPEVDKEFAAFLLQRAADMKLGA